MFDIASPSYPSVRPLGRTLRQTASSAALGLTLTVCAMASHAVTIYSGPVNLAIPASTNGLYLNVVTGANNLPPPGTGGSTVPGWDLNIWSTTGLGFFNPVAPASGVYVATVAGTVANLAAGSVIGSSNLYSNGLSGSNAQWVLNSSDNLFGFRFLNEATGAVHYGWARLALTSPITGTRTLVEYAYENVAGASIQAGFTGVIPEPSTYAMMGLGVAALLLRRRQQA